MGQVSLNAALELFGLGDGMHRPPSALGRPE